MLKKYKKHGTLIVNKKNLPTKDKDMLRRKRIMINVMFVCSAGMSTSLLVEKVKKEAAANGVEMNIYAVGESEAKKDLKQAEVLLLGPQVRYLESAFRKELAGSEVKLAVIEMRTYGLMDGKKVYQQIMELLG